MLARKSFENINLDESLAVGLIENSSRDLGLNAHNPHSVLPTNEHESEVSILDNLQGDSSNKLTGVSALQSVEISPDCRNGPSCVTATVLSELLKYNLNDYLQENLIEQYSFCRKVSVDTIMQWGSKELTQPLTKIPKELEAVSIQLFRNLLSYMLDRNSSKQPLDHVKKHIKLTLNACVELKDEAYVQVLKQIKNHRDPYKGLRGWNFLAMLASCYAPSTKLYYSILNFLFVEIKQNSDANIVNHANYIFVRLFKTFTLKRKNIPSDNELIYIEQMKPISIPVYFFSETCSTTQVESYTTVKEVKSAIINYLQFSLNRSPYYSLYEVCNKKTQIEERFLDDSERICDVLSLWDREMEEHLKKKEPIEFKVYLKIFLHYPYSENDVDTTTIVYTQSVYDVINGKYVLKEQDIITLAALQLLVSFSTNQEGAYQALQKSLERYVPAVQINLNPNVYWVQKIMELYSGLKSSTKLEAKQTYVEHLKSSPLWEAHQFVVKYPSSKNPDNSENFPAELILGIKPEGISILNSEREELVYVPYNIIANWGISSTMFVIVVTKIEGISMKHYFEVTQPKIIHTLMESYTNIIAGKSIVEIQAITQDYDKRFESLITGRSRSATNFSRSEQ